MGFLSGLIRPLSRLNDHVLRVGRAIGITAVAVMVVVTLLQVFSRYVLNSALSWPDEAARFCMLWMTGLMAPTAFRAGGFVAIDVLPEMLPATVARILNLILLCVSFLVLYVTIPIAWAEVTGIGGRFASASLHVPISLDFSQWYRVPRSWMMASLLVGAVMLIAVNVELLLRNIALLLGVTDLPRIPTTDTQGAE